MNEAIFYAFCVSLICFSGVITDPAQRATLGEVVVALTLTLIAFNICVILYDLSNFVRLLYSRYRVFIKRYMSKFTVKRRVKIHQTPKASDQNLETEAPLKEDDEKEALPLYFAAKNHILIEDDFHQELPKNGKPHEFADDSSIIDDSGFFKPSPLNKAKMAKEAIAHLGPLDNNQLLSVTPKNFV